MAVSLALEDLVQKPMWKELLFELIETRQLDPWNVDIIALADGFLKKIKEMEKMELAVPGNTILAASILLRHKTDGVVWEEPAPPVAFAEGAPPFEELPSLTLASRLLPRRQITLDELVQEMERVIRYEGERLIKPRGGIDTFVELPIAQVDIDQRMEETYGRLKTLQDQEGWVLFSRLAQNREEIIPVLMALLHLAQKEKIDLYQEVFFQEILIRILEGKKEKEVRL